MESTELYYSHPVQVKYYNVQLKKYIGGIVYKDFLISGKTGTVYKIEDYIKRVKSESNLIKDKIIIELSWTDLSAEILG